MGDLTKKSLVRSELNFNIEDREIICNRLWARSQRESMLKSIPPDYKGNLAVLILVIYQFLWPPLRFAFLTDKGINHPAFWSIGLD
jgi:hypothetical protein